MQATRRRTQAQRRASTRASLLRAAAAVFAAKGFAACSLDDVAARAGLSKGALTYHFTTKEALFRALAEESLGERIGRVQALPDWIDPGDPGAARQIVAALPHDREWSLLFLEFVCHGARRRRFRDVLVGPLEEARAEASAAIEAVGLGDPERARLLADGLSALSNGMSIEALLDGDDRRASELFGLLLDLILKGLAASRAAD